MAHDDRASGRNRDQDLLGELRRVMAELDPVPPETTAYAKAAFGWRRLDADLAELLMDSMLESESLAGTRSGTTDARSVTFRARTLEIELEIADDADGGIVLLGQLAPAIAARVEVQRDDGSGAGETDADALGRFRLALAARGRIRLKVVPAGDAPAGAVETSWLVV